MRKPKTPKPLRMWYNIDQIDPKTLQVLVKTVVVAHGIEEACRLVGVNPTVFTFTECRAKQDIASAQEIGKGVYTKSDGEWVEIPTGHWKTCIKNKAK